MRIYLSGPMTGYPSYNVTGFATYARLLRLQTDHEIINPFDLDSDDVLSKSVASEDGRHFSEQEWAEFIARDVRVVANCDAIAVMPGWINSRGCAVETMVASILGRQVLYADTLAPIHRDVLASAWGQWA